MQKRSRMPKDQNQLAKLIVEMTTADEKKVINQAAATLGRLGGAKGGPARARALTPEKRSEIAKKAAQARWDKKKL